MENICKVWPHSRVSLPLYISKFMFLLSSSPSDSENFPDHLTISPLLADFISPSSKILDPILITDYTCVCVYVWIEPLLLHFTDQKQCELISHMKGTLFIDPPISILLIIQNWIFSYFLFFQQREHLYWNQYIYSFSDPALSGAKRRANELSSIIHSFAHSFR